MSEIGDQGLRPEHVRAQPPGDEQIAAEEKASRTRGSRSRAEPPHEPAPRPAGEKQERTA
ncbi:hypothetical protein ACWGJP_08650 [Microbacterium sp. NPDC055903]